MAHRCAADDHERRRILTQRDVARHHAESSDPGELMGARLATHDDIATDLAMAGEHDAIRQNHVVFHDAVVADVCAGHEEAVRADVSLGAGLVGAVDGHELTQHVVVADYRPGLGAVVAGVLRIAADHGMRIDDVVLADPREAADDDVGADACARADVHVALDDGTRPYARRRIDDGIGRYDSRAVDVRLGHRAGSDRDPRQCGRGPHGFQS